ncbi:MAG: NAD kinase [Solobacterium sp.]|nr:NAD kinase [Solobacterium sp.]
MKKYTIVSRPDKLSASLEGKTRKTLSAHGYIYDEDEPEVVFVIGGDGTFIYAVHQYLDQLDKVCFYGIHTGTLGFYTDYQEADYEEFIETFLSGKYAQVYYPMLHVVTDQDEYYALNEMRIENAARTQEIDVLLDDRLFEEYRGTGLILSTQLGSTAYNRSLGGAVLQEGLPLVQLCEIAGIHHSAYRSLGSPLVMRNNIKITLRSNDYRGALLGIDSDVYWIEDVHEITVLPDVDKKVRVLRGRTVSYFSRLKSLF